MSGIFLDPFSDDFHKVFHLRRLRISQHRYDFSECLATFLPSDDFLEHADSCPAFSLPVPDLRISNIGSRLLAASGSALWSGIEAFQHVKSLERIEKVTGPIAVICKNLKHDK